MPTKQRTAAGDKAAEREAKQREKDRAAKQKEKERAAKAKEREREKAAKLKEKERAAKQKDKERAAKQKDKERAAKQKDKERAAKQKDKERAAKQKDKERAAKQKDKERAAKQKERAARQKSGRTSSKAGIPPYGEIAAKLGKESAVSRSTNEPTVAASFTTRDHDVIREWVESRSGRPAEVRGTEDGGSGIGVLRIEFRDEQDNLEPADWDAFFATFDDSDVDFLYQEHTSDGSTSRFNRIIRADA